MIIQALRKSGLNLKRTGGNYSTLCPFHSDTDPSFTVYPRTNSWYCFGCGLSGDTIEFLKRKNRWNYNQAKAWIEGNNFPVESQELFKIGKPKERTLPDEFVTYWHNMMTDRSFFYKRGFCDEFINLEMWGWDGKRHTIPVWEGQPGNSDCVGVRRRKLDGNRGFNYIGLKGVNHPTVWGRWYCQSDIILAFCGELDAARAVQDGFPSFSIVNGVGSVKRFPYSWPELWFPNSKSLIVAFDKKEEPFAGRLAQDWNNAKGSMTARIFNWPPDFTGKDYCNFRDQNFTSEDFQSLIYSQLNLFVPFESLY